MMHLLNGCVHCILLLSNSSTMIGATKISRTLLYQLRWQRKETFLLLCLLFFCKHHSRTTTVVSLSAAGPSRHRSSLAIVEDCLLRASAAFITAGELTSDMASKLPNWYSSKEGLTGESPAVFGGCGMSLVQAGTSLLAQERTAGRLSSVTDRLESCACDLASAACALDPIGIGEPMDRACGAMYDWVALELHQQENSEYSSNSASSINELSNALIDCEASFREYGELLLAEDTLQGENAAGSILSRAGDHLGRAAAAFSQIYPR